MSKVIIIGGGIIGLSSAYYLHKKGHNVTVLDMGTLTDNCSYGNAGMIVPSHFVPLSAPGMIAKGVRWMFSRKSPFYIQPSVNPHFLNWGLRFVRNANNEHVERSAVPLCDISLLSKSLYEKLATEAGFQFGLKGKGILAFYKTEKVAAEEVKLAEKAAGLGLDMSVLNAAECRALQPNLQLDVLGAVHYRCDAHLSPQDLIHSMTRYLEANNVRIVRNEKVTRVNIQGGKITSLITENNTWQGDQFVLSAGSWSSALAKMMGITISMMPGKGYSFMNNQYNSQLEIPALLCEAKVAITPMNNSIRFSGTMEIGKMSHQIKTDRLKGIIDAVPKYFPGIKPGMPPQGEVWQGFRPCSPDGLPYIGYDKLKNLVVGTGHGMMGISLGLATGHLISQLVSGQQPDLNLKPFAPTR